MNSDLVRENARYMAGRIIDRVGEDRQRLYDLILGWKR